MNSLLRAVSPLTTLCIVYDGDTIQFWFFKIFTLQKLLKLFLPTLNLKVHSTPPPTLEHLKGLKNLEKLLELYLCDLEPLKAVPIPNCYCTIVL